MNDRVLVFGIYLENRMRLELTYNPRTDARYLTASTVSSAKGTLK